MDRTRAWLAVSPVIGAGVLGAHALAYRVTGTPTGALHSYLDHAPQILVVLAVAGIALAGVGARLRAPAPWLFPAAALAVFVVQEHVERLAHTGELPVLLASPAFLVGVLLQIPVAVVAWALARRLLAALAEAAARSRTISRAITRLLLPKAGDVRPIAVREHSGRGPPVSLRL